MYFELLLIGIIIFQQVLYTKLSDKYEVILEKFRMGRNKIITLQHELIVQKQQTEIEKGHTQRLRESIQIERENSQKKEIEMKVIHTRDTLEDDYSRDRKRKCKPIHFGDDGLIEDDLKSDPNYRK